MILEQILAETDTVFWRVDPGARIYHWPDGIDSVLLSTFSHTASFYTKGNASSLQHFRSVYGGKAINDTGYAGKC